MTTTKRPRTPRKTPTPAPGPNPEQLAALREYAAQHGRTWKAALSADWMRAGSATFPRERWALLQQVRNALGPSWLVKFRLPPLPIKTCERCEANFRLLPEQAIPDHRFRGIPCVASTSVRLALPAHIAERTDAAEARGHALVSQGCALFRCTRCDAHGYCDTGTPFAHPCVTGPVTEQNAALTPHPVTGSGVVYVSDNPSCPECKRYNAILQNPDGSGVCRDCGYAYTKVDAPAAVTSRPAAVPPPAPAAPSEIRDVIATFPATFGLHGFPGKTFRISERASYLDDHDRVVLYTQRLMPDNSWADFAKGSATQLRSQISEIRCAVLPSAVVAAEQGIADAAARDRAALVESQMPAHQRASVAALLAWAKARNDEGLTELCRDALDALDDGDRATPGALDCLQAAIEMVYQIELANRIATHGPLKGEATGNEYVVTRRPIRMTGILVKFRERADAEKWIAAQTRPLVLSPVNVTLRTGHLCNACGVFCDATTPTSEHADWCPHGVRAAAGLPQLCPYCGDATRSDSLAQDYGVVAHAKCVKAASS